MSPIATWQWIMSWIAGVALLLIAVSLITHRTWLHRFDQAVIRAVRRPVTPRQKKLIIAVTTAGNPLPVTTLTALIALALWLTNYRLAAAYLVLNVLGWAGIGTSILKFVIRRPRPTNDWLVMARSFSFPSGHADTVILLWGSLAVLLPTLITLPLSGYVAIVILVGLWILAVGISRIYVGVHYPTDVLAGWLFGFCCLNITQWLLTR